MDIQKIFEKVQSENVFIKTTEKTTIDSSQKAVLNRKGNILFNSGDIEAARRIFMTTGYTDGLNRVGDYYNSKGRPLEALRMYWISPDRKKAEALIYQLSIIIQDLVHND